MSLAPAIATLPNLSAETVRRFSRGLERLTGETDAWSFDALRGVGRGGKRILKATSGTTGRQVVVKAHGRRLRNIQEYLALLDLRKATRDAIAPVFLAPDAGFLAMEWCDAPTLWQRVEGPERRLALVRAGAWLGGLHAAPPIRGWTGRIPARLAPPTSGCTGDVAEAARRLRARQDRLPRDVARRGVLHGDFHPGNLLDMGDRVFGFDRERPAYGILLIDVAKFLARIAERRALAAASGQPWDGDAEADRQAFFDGYGALPEAELALLDLVEDRAIFDIWRRRSATGDGTLGGDMAERGLIGTERITDRPGRLIASGHGAAIWTRDLPPPQRRRSLLGLRAASV